MKKLAVSWPVKKHIFIHLAYTSMKTDRGNYFYVTMVLSLGVHIHKKYLTQIIYSIFKQGMKIFF